jgi:ribosome-binding factor A
LVVLSGHRAERVADLVQRIVARSLGELRDPRVGFVTVTAVRMSPDLRHATVYFTVIDPDAHAVTEDGLRHAAPFLRRALSRDATLRRTPELHFVYDETAESARRVEGLLHELEPPSAAREGGDER